MNYCEMYTKPKREQPNEYPNYSSQSAGGPAWFSFVVCCRRFTQEESFISCAYLTRYKFYPRGNKYIRRAFEDSKKFNLETIG